MPLLDHGCLLVEGQIDGEVYIMFSPLSDSLLTQLVFSIPIP